MTLSKSASLALKQYAWPGNIRELSHIMERAVLLNQGDKLEVESLNLVSQSSKQDLPMMTLEQAEILLLKKALSTTDNNITHAAKLLGLTKSSLYRRLEKYDNIQN